MVKQVLSLVFLFSFSSVCAAKTLWSDFSVTYLNGNNYQVGDSDREVYTFEYAAGTDWGDAFLFVDRLKSANGDYETYGEFTPRIRVSSFETSWFKNVYVVPSVEMVANEFVGDNNYLLGLGTDLVIPGFNYVQLTGFHRNNERGDNSWQATLVWALPIGPLMYDGFIDYATHVDNIVPGTNGKTHMNFTSQLKYDIAPHLNLDNKFYLGIEYVYWNNKFGIDGVDERNVNLLAKFHF